jgi:predicted permease
MRWAFWRRRTTDDFSSEIEAHLALETERLVRSGMAREDAVFAARRAFGNVTATQERFRDGRPGVWFERLVQDVHYALRAMRRSPGFTAVALLSLAIGIGANAAIFSTINELLVKTLPVVDPDQLVMLRADDTPQGPQWGYAWFSYDLFRNFREQAQGFTDVAAIGVLDRFNVNLRGSGGGLDPARTRVAIVSGNYFSLLGIRAAWGRAISATDDLVPGGHPVAVISDGYWRGRLARTPDVVGRNLAFNGTTYDVIGVMPRGFSGDWVGRPIDIWVPMMMEAQVSTERPGLSSANFLRIVGRLRPGVTLQRAERDAAPLYKRLRDEEIGPRRLSGSPVDWFGLAPAGGGYSPQRDSYGTSLAILAVAVVLVLVIACANVANLLLARSETRQREMALRLAIGAGAGRIARQLITESVVLAVIGGTLGVLLSVWVTGVVGSVIGGSPIPVDSRNVAQPLALSLHPDTRVLLFSVGLSLLTAIAFGFAPALRGARAPVAATLTSRGEASSGTRRRHPMSRLLVAVQVALSLPLLIGAGLFARSLQDLRAVDLGFDRQHTLLVWTSPGQTGRTGPALAALAQTVVARLSALPGVRSASVASNGVLTGLSDESGGRSENAWAEGATPKPGVLGISLTVSAGYFETLGLRVLAGRSFTEADGSGPRVGVINETMRRTLFGDVDPIGRHYYLLPRDAATPTQVIGVVPDVKVGSPRDRARMIEYVPALQGSARLNNMCVLVRTIGPAAGAANRVRSELAAIDPGLPVIGVDTMDEQLDDVLAQDRLLADLAVAAGLVVALLTCLGLYCVISYVTAQRTREIGVRVALGATRTNIMTMVVGESGTLVVAGIVLGVPLTLASTHYASARLYGVSAGDPAYVAGAIALMLGVALIASVIPAQRASRVDPMDALRAE